MALPVIPNTIILSVHMCILLMYEELEMSKLCLTNCLPSAMSLCVLIVILELYVLAQYLKACGNVKCVLPLLEGQPHNPAQASVVATARSVRKETLVTRVRDVRQRDSSSHADSTLYPDSTLDDVGSNFIRKGKQLLFFSQSEKVTSYNKS